MLFVSFLAVIVYTSGIFNGAASTFVTIATPDGCPFRTDDGSYGLVYVKPPFCKQLLPVDRNISDHAEYGPPPFFVKLYYTNDLDTFRVRVSSPNRTLAMYDVWVVTSRLSSYDQFRHPIGLFNQQISVQLFCCDWTRRRTSARFSSTYEGKLRPFHTAEFLWSPLNFTGRVVFIANIFVSEYNWYGGVSSKVYYMPPDWPDFLRQPTGVGAVHKFDIFDTDTEDDDTSELLYHEA